MASISNRSLPTKSYGYVVGVEAKEEKASEVGIAYFESFPFWNSVAEYDYRIDESLDHSPVFERSSTLSPTDYYVDPFYSEGYQTTLKQLRQREHAFVYGEPGTGKTTLRYALESHLRGWPDGTLVVTHKASGRVTRRVSLDEHFDCLAQELAVDLLIQIVEQFSSTYLPTPEQNIALGVLLRAYGPAIRRIVGHLATDTSEQQSKVWGFAALWQRVDRPVVRPVRRSSELQVWLQEILSQWSKPHEKLPSGRAGWQYALTTARLWGFRDVFIMVDAEHNDEPIIASIEALLEHLNLFTADDVYLKFFLPIGFNPEVESLLKNPAIEPSSCADAPIILLWDDDALKRLMRERFRAARSSRSGFADLIDDDIEDYDAFLLDEANGSPRRLLILIRGLIDQFVSQSDADEDAFAGTSISQYIANPDFFEPVLAGV